MGHTNNEIFLPSLGKTILKLMNQRGKIQSDLVRETNLSRSYVSEIINGKKSPDLKTLNLICSSLKINISFLFLKELEFRNEEENGKSDIFKKINSNLEELDKLIFPENYDSDISNSQLPKLKSQKLILNEN